MATEEKLLRTNIRTSPLSGIVMNQFDPFYSRSASADTVNFDKARYSLTDVILKGPDIQGLEREISNEYESRLTRNFTTIKGSPAGVLGTMVPLQMLCRSLGYRDLSATGGNSTGGDLIETTLEKTWIEALYPFSACICLGGRSIENLVGSFAFPRVQTGAVSSGLGENVQVTDNLGVTASITFSQATMSPFRISAIPFRISKQLLTQSASRSSEALIQSELLRAIGSTIDAYILAGNGSNQPLGILSQAENTAGQHVTNLLSAGQTFSGAATYAKLIALQGEVLAANIVPDGTFGWGISPATWNRWAQIPQLTGYPRYLLENFEGSEQTNSPLVGKVLNSPCAVTNNLSATNQCLFGRFSDLLLGWWGGVDLVSNPYTYAGSNIIEINLSLLFNYCLLRPVAFAKSEDSASQ